MAFLRKACSYVRNITMHMILNHKIDHSHISFKVDSDCD